MYCCIPDVNGCFKKLFRLLFPRLIFSRFVILVFVLASLWILNRFGREDSEEAPFCQNQKFPEFVLSPARFVPASSSSSTIDRTPQNSSGLWVVYNYLSPIKSPKNNFVTLSTHVTTDFLTPELSELVTQIPAKSYNNISILH